MNRFLSRLAGILAISIATFTLVFSSGVALACNPGAHAAHGQHHQQTNGSDREPVMAVAAKRASHDVANAADHHEQHEHRIALSDSSKLPRQVSHEGQCPPHKHLCCYECPEALEVIVLPVRQRDAPEAVTWWISGFIVYAMSLTGLGDSALHTHPRPDPMGLVQRNTWRTILLMGSARLRI